MFDSDLYRYYGKKKETIRQRLFRRPELRYLALFRKVQNTKNKILKCVYRYKLRKMSMQTMIDIPPETEIGEGLYLGHTGSRIINPNCKIGRNVNIATGVVIGKTNRGDNKGIPTIGDKVWIGSNVVIVGKIQIGNNVLIAPNSYVNKDVPDNSIVIGNPAVIHHSEKATEGYCSNLIESENNDERY